MLERDCIASGRCTGILYTVEKLQWHENARALLSALWVLQRAQVADLLNDGFFDQPAFQDHAWGFQLWWRQGVGAKRQAEQLRRRLLEVRGAAATRVSTARLASLRLRPRPDLAPTSPPASPSASPRPLAPASP